MKKILIFGASGDTGKYLVKYFLEHISKTEKVEIIASGTKETSFFLILWGLITIE